MLEINLKTDIRLPSVQFGPLKSPEHMQTKPVGLLESAWHVASLGHGLSAQTFTRISQLRPETNVTCDRYLFVCVEV